MGHSILVFVSHSSEDKADYIEPIIADLEQCYINVWFDKRKILPGDNLRKSIFRDGLDKADVALIFFTQHSLQSSWVDREIKHILREETTKGNDFNLRKIISVFDSDTTYASIADRYPELTDDLLHLMPNKYNKIQLGQLISAVWSKYLDLQGGDVETQRQLLDKDKQLFQKDKENHDLEIKLQALKDKTKKTTAHDEFEEFYSSGRLNRFLAEKDQFLQGDYVANAHMYDGPVAAAFGLVKASGNNIMLTDKGANFLKWFILEKEKRS